MTRHYHTLDGMRGIAALAVVCGHAAAFLVPFSVPGFYLAVDFFFALSGFVICHAYEKNLREGLPVLQFFLLRLVRFYPLYMLGCLIGALSAVAAFVGGGGNLDAHGLAAAILSGFLFLPSPTWLQEQWVVPINGPGWSLILELWINVLYALVLPRLRLRTVAITALTSSIIFAVSILSAGNADFGSTWNTALGGIFRVTALFSIGVLIFRMPRKSMVSSWKAWAVALSIIPIFLFPAPPSVRPYFDIVASLVVLPCCVYMGARYESRSTGLFIQLGALSFAIYATHSPILLFLRRVAKILHFSLESFAPLSGVLVLTGLVAFGLALDRYYDRPARRIIMRMRPFSALRENRNRALPSS